MQRFQGALENAIATQWAQDHVFAEKGSMPFSFVLGGRPASGVSGKSSDGPDGWPYWNLKRPGGGVILAVGWPGQWVATFARDQYPEGFRPFSDKVRANGMQFLLWFEPERVGNPKSWLGRNHPEWLMPGNSAGDVLKNEGVVQAFRRLEATDETLTVKLRGLDPTVRYEIDNLDGGKEVRTGAELLRGLNIAPREKPAAAVLVLNAMK